MSEHAAELERVDEQLGEVRRERRELLVRHIGDEYGLRPEARPVAAALIDWTAIDVGEYGEFDVWSAMCQLQREHDYLFIPELLPRFGSADGGAKSFRDDEDSSQPMTRSRVKQLLVDAYGG